MGGSLSRERVSVLRGLCKGGSLFSGVSVQGKGLCPGGVCLGGFCPGEVSIQGKGLCPGKGSLSRRSLSRGVSVQGKGLCLGGSLSRGLCRVGSLSGGSLSRERVSVQGGLTLGHLCPGVLCPGGSLLGRPPHCTVTSGWYASNWNAFLSVKYQQRLLEPATSCLRDKMLLHNPIEKKLMS